jgi:alkylresorcinol/alkylpyrone synthase
VLAAGRCARVLSIFVEVCSAAFFLDDDPGVLISACLFGDGAGAAVLGSVAAGKRRVKWKAAGSVLKPEARDLLRFEQSQGMLRNILSAEVPTVAARGARQVLGNVLAEEELDRSRIAAWVFHPGGRDVLTALRKELGLSGLDVRHSEAVLAEYGNLSSPSVFFVLQATLAECAPSGLWWMSSFGAGFSCHGALLEVE